MNREPFTVYTSEHGHTWAFGTPEFAARLPDESFEAWTERMCQEAARLGVDSFCPYGEPED